MDCIGFRAQGSQNYGPVSVYPNSRCRNIVYNQKGPMILRTILMQKLESLFSDVLSADP